MRRSEVPGTTGATPLGGALGAAAFARARVSASRRAVAAAIAVAAISPLLAVPARPPMSGPRATVPLMPTRWSVITTLSLPLRTQAARTSVPAAERTPSDRTRLEAASVAAMLLAVQRGAAIVRVHDVSAAVAALAVWQAASSVIR